MRAISENIGFTTDYTRLLCRSLARGGYIAFAGGSECRLLEKGRSRFENVFLEEVSEEPAVHTANITLLTDTKEDASALVDKEADKEEEISQPVNDEALDKVLADLNSSPKSAEGEHPKEESSGMGGNADTATMNEVDAFEGEAGDIPVATGENSTETKEDQIESANAPVAVSSLDELPDASEKDKEKLVQAGYKSAEDVAQAPVAKLIQGLGVSLRKAANWINQARRQTGVIDEGGRKDKK